MKKYRVVLTVTADEFVSVFKNLSGSGFAFNVDDINDDDDKPARAPHKKATTRRKRGSKVFETILDRLSKGEAAAADLRSSLEAAGLSPASLSTGLALLQKDGKVRRNAEGSYTLADAA